MIDEPVEVRIDRLERAFDAIQANLGAIAEGMSRCLLALQTIPEVVVTKKLRIVNEQTTVLASIEADENGGGSLMLCAADGAVLSIFTTRDAGGRVEVFSPAGESYALTPTILERSGD